MPEKQMKNLESIILEDGTTIYFLDLLNKEGSCFAEDTENDNKGYPVLK